MYSSILQRNGEAAKLLFWIINGLGSSPYNPNLPSKLRMIPILYSVLLALWFTLQIPVGLYFLFSTPMSMSKAALIFQNLCESVIPILVVSESLKQKGQVLQDMMVDVVYTDQCLHGISVENDFEKIKQIFSTTFKCVSAYAVVYFLSITYLLMKIFKNSVSFQTALFFALFNYSCVLYNIYLSYFYWVSLCSFQCRFKLVNDELSSIMKPKYKKERPIHLAQSLICNMLKRIKTIRLVHAVYRYLIKKHHCRFTVVITLQYFQSVIVITVSLYILVCMVLNIGSFKQTEILVAAVIIINIIQCFFAILFPIIICSANISIEANNMESVVHELMSQTEDKELLKELEDFSLELLHEKVALTACGFFEINYSSFTKMAATVISYVIIFLQFGNFDYHELLLVVNKNETNQTHVS